MTELVHVDVVDEVATVTLDSPANRNALGRALTGQLLDALEAAGADDGARVVLLRSAGPVFCSGADMREAVDDGMEAVAGPWSPCSGRWSRCPSRSWCGSTARYAPAGSGWSVRPTWSCPPRPCRSRSPRCASASPRRRSR